MSKEQNICSDRSKHYILDDISHCEKKLAKAVFSFLIIPLKSDKNQHEQIHKTQISIEQNIFCQSTYKTVLTFNHRDGSVGKKFMSSGY